MFVMNHLAYAAAALLLIELFFVVALFAGLTGGLAFGTWWLNSKAGWVFGRANGYIGVVRRYVRVGTDYAARPFIELNVWMRRAQVTAGALRRQVQSFRAVGRHASRPTPPRSP